MPSPKLRRGFKTEAEEASSELRAELGIHESAPLHMDDLAEHLRIPVIGLSELRDACPKAIQFFANIDTGAFSAATVFDGSRRMIVHNDSHSDGRRSSNLGHELAHGILLHDPKPALNEYGCRYWDPVIEEEATWLAGAILVPRAAAVLVARREPGLTVEEAAGQYMVSTEMMNYRLNITGARNQARRRRKQ